MASSHQSIPFINGAVSPDDSSTKMKTPRSSADNRAVSPDSVKILLLHQSSSPVSADASAMTRMRGNTTNTLWWWKGGGGGVATQMSRASPFERDPYSIWEMGKVADSKMPCHSVANNGAAAKVVNPVETSSHSPVQTHPTVPTNADPNNNSNIPTPPFLHFLLSKKAEEGRRAIQFGILRYLDLDEEHVSEIYTCIAPIKVTYYSTSTAYSHGCNDC
jgi:hypothetical protein